MRFTSSYAWKSHSKLSVSSFVTLLFMLLYTLYLARFHNYLVSSVRLQSVLNLGTFPASGGVETIVQKLYTFHQPLLSVENFNRSFINRDELSIDRGSYKSPLEVRNLAIIIPFRDRAEKVRERQLYAYLHHTLRYLVKAGFWQFLKGG